MILKIIPSILINNEFDPSCKVIDYNMFNDISFHPFIATNIWEKVVIVLDKGIRNGFIKQVLSKGNIVEFIVPSGVNINYDILNKFIEVYPDISIELRQSFMSGKDIKDILIKEGVVFE